MFEAVYRSHATDKSVEDCNERRLEGKDVDEDTLNGRYKISPPAALRLLHAFE